jgi:mRNA interferase MazF
MLAYIGGREPAQIYRKGRLLSMERKIRRGDMFYADLTLGVGSEQSGYRPVLIIQNDTGNRHSQTVIAALITSRTAHKTKLPTHCPLKRQQGLGRDSLVLLEQIRTIDKTRLKEFIGTLEAESMSKVNMALAVSVGLKGGYLNE